MKKRGIFNTTQPPSSGPKFKIGTVNVQNTKKKIVRGTRVKRITVTHTLLWMKTPDEDHGSSRGL